MSQAIWNELQELKSRVAELEKRIGVPAPQPDVLEAFLERLDRVERTLQRNGKR